MITTIVRNHGCVVLLTLWACACAAETPVAWWSFDETPTLVRSQASNSADSVQLGEETLLVTQGLSQTETNLLHGHFKQAAGVVGKALLFDGFTTRLIRPASGVPNLDKGWTIEAWIAPQEYSWAQTGIVDLDDDEKAGFCFSINHMGKIGIHASVGGQWQGCESPESVPLLSWSHVAATFDPEVGFGIYINGQRVIQKETRGAINQTKGFDLFIGMAHRKQFPALTERKTSKKLLSNMIFDGLIDEVKIHDRALTVDEIKAAFAAITPGTSQPLRVRVLPSGPKEARPFGAYYTQLAYCPEWDRLWRTGDYADVLVCFGDLPVRLVFWRGTGYCPAWVTGNGKWVCDQSPESWNWETWGCFEHMSDKRCLFSHVRVLESSEARAVVHWRVASASINYDFNHVDPDTDWGEWTDEYYTIYPDAVAVRYQEVRSTWAENMEWQQSELINPPGTRPQDNIETNAMTVVNMLGETETWNWTTSDPKLAPGSTAIKGGMIQVMNLKSAQRHFVIGEPKAHWEPAPAGWNAAFEGFATMHTWSHWPAAQLPNDGCVACGVDRPSSTCLGTLIPEKHKTDRPDKMIGQNLYGLTDKPAGELSMLARSWNYPAELKVTSGAIESSSYDKSQRAYVIKLKSPGDPQTLGLRLEGSFKSPVLNPAFVIKNWGMAAAKIQVNGKNVERGSGFRYGNRASWDGSDLIVWVKTQATNEWSLELNPILKPDVDGR